MTENKYTNGKIYKIESPNHEKCYVGSTCTKLCARLAKHKNSYKAFKEGKRKHNMASSEIIEAGDPFITLIENYPCNNKEELLKREREWFEKLDCVNIKYPLRSRAEYAKTEKAKATKEAYRTSEHGKEITKKNRDKPENKTTKSNYDKEYYEERKEKIKAKARKYHTENREAILEKQKKYREEKAEYFKQKVTCECGIAVARQELGRHKKTQRHKTKMEELI